MQTPETPRETGDAATGRGASRGNSAARALAVTDVETLTTKWHRLSPEIRMAIMAIFYSSQKAEPNSGDP